MSLRRDNLIDLGRRLGILLPRRCVCPGHSAPLDYVEQWYYDRPPLSLVTGPRGGGKSYLAAFATFLDSIRYVRHGTRVLGGSMAQSEQIYNALKAFSGPPSPAGLFRSITKTHAELVTGSDVSILAATSTSVRGPHIPTLRLDEVDEIDPEIRDASVGMCMSRGGARGMISMTSTWHRVGGPMGELIERAGTGEFPAWTFCTFEVLEACDSLRSGPRVGGPDLYAGCPECPIRKWCHADVRPHPDTGVPEPKAKRSAGHYSIDSLIQKARIVSARTFEADYLCSGPKADGLWFPAFNRDSHVGEDAEYDPAFHVSLPIDCGSSRTTGAVFLQVRERALADGGTRHLVTVFDEYLGQDLVSEDNARALHRQAESRCNGKLNRIRLDPASKQRTSIGPVVYTEYEKVFGSRLIAPWPLMLVRDSLDLLDSFVRPAGGGVDIRIHPRCVNLINAFANYRRKKVGPTYTDTPEQVHPHEDMIDALRGGIGDHFPDGRRPVSRLARVPIARAFGRS